MIMFWMMKRWRCNEVIEVLFRDVGISGCGINGRNDRGRK